MSTTLIDRLAVSRIRQGDSLGSLLLADAVQRAYASAETVGSSMLVVDALSERAAAFYEPLGFQPLPESLRLVLPMRSIEELLARYGPQRAMRSEPPERCEASAPSGRAIY